MLLYTVAVSLANRTDQLEWLITASPHPLDDNENTLVEGILDYLRRQREDGGNGSQPGSTDEMSELIVEYCIGSYERRPNSARQTLPKDLLSIRQMFSNSIKIIVRKSVPATETFKTLIILLQDRDKAKLFDQFRSREAQKGDRSQSRSDQLDERDESQQSTESEGHKQGTDAKMREAVKTAGELSAKIKDIRDELKVLRSAAQYQMDVQERMYMGHSGGKEMSPDGRGMRCVLGADLSGKHVVNDIIEMEIIANTIQEEVSMLTRE